MIKKILVLVFSLLLLCGCNSKEKTIYEYYVTVDNIDVKVDLLFDYLRVSLDNYNDIKIEDNKKIYIYNDIEIETYKKDGLEKVLGFWFTSNKYNTNEGVRIGDNIDKMVYVYGYNYDYNNGIYVYRLNNSSITFVTEDGIIRGIEYNLV